MTRVLLAAALAASLGACANAPAGSGYPSVAQQERACANAGIAPGSGRFARCVTNLQGSTSDDNRPG